MKTPEQDVLQWGHILSDVDSAHNGTPQLGLLLLQWGHILSDVDSAK